MCIGETGRRRREGERLRAWTLVHMMGRGLLMDILLSSASISDRRRIGFVVHTSYFSIYASTQSSMHLYYAASDCRDAQPRLDASRPRSLGAALPFPLSHRRLFDSTTSCD